MSARGVAQAFADHLNSILNRTVTDARLTLIAARDAPARFTLSCLRGAEPASFGLYGSPVRLAVVQALEVIGDHCETLTYQYRLSLGESKDSWLIRWEYMRRRPTDRYPYPLAHVHVNARWATGSAAPAADLSHTHVPTRRMPLELVLWYAIVELHVTPRQGSWRDLLEESIRGFDARRHVS